jgi:hypothetical protein
MHCMLTQLNGTRTKQKQNHQFFDNFLSYLVICPSQTMYKRQIIPKKIDHDNTSLETREHFLPTKDYLLGIWIKICI